MTSFVLLDTCVWLTVAQEQKLREVLSQLEANVAAGRIVLLVPEEIKVEFARNRDPIVKKHQDRFGTYVKHARELLSLMEADARQVVEPAIEQAEQRARSQTDQVADALVRAEGLMAHASTISLPTTEAARFAVVDRALKKLAPFHRAKNSVADALLVECFREFLHVVELSDESDAYFVTENTSDLSAPTNPTQPHDDYRHIFSGDRVKYSINIAAVLNSIRPEEAMRKAAANYPVHATIRSALCSKGGAHAFDSTDGAYLRSQYGGLTWHERCSKCGIVRDTGDFWE